MALAKTATIMIPSWSDTIRQEERRPRKRRRRRDPAEHSQNGSIHRKRVLCRWPSVAVVLVAVMMILSLTTLVVVDASAVTTTEQGHDVLEDMAVLAKQQQEQPQQQQQQPQQQQLQQQVKKEQPPPENREEDVLLLPMDDGHFSSNTNPLPEFLSDASECTCEQPWNARRRRSSWQTGGSSSSTTTCSVLEEEDSTTTTTTTTTMARIFYLLVIHNERTLQDAVSLFRAIRHSKNIIVIHVDVKFNYDQYYVNSVLHQEIQACPCGSIVETASIHNASWSTWSMNLPTLWGMEKAVVDYAGQWDVFVNLSGDSLPVYTAPCLGHILWTVAVQPQYNYVTSSSCETGLQPTPLSFFPSRWHKRVHYSYKPANLTYVEEFLNHADKDADADADATTTRHPPTLKQRIPHSNVTLETYFGSQWMILQPDFCHYLIQELKRSDSLPSQFRDYLIQTKKLMTDETFIPTLIMYLFPKTIPPVNETDSSLVLPPPPPSQQQTLHHHHHHKKNDDYHHQGISLVPPKIYSIRYERMDEQAPSSRGYFPIHQRYEVPESSSSRVDQVKPWGPYFLGVYDLESLHESGALYIRKVSQWMDPNLYKILPVEHADDIPPIGWPKNEIKLSPVPDWEKTIQQLKEQYYKKKKKQEEEANAKGKAKTKKNSQAQPHKPEKAGNAAEAEGKEHYDHGEDGEEEHYDHEEVEEDGEEEEEDQEI
jgi:Core-2/I-Branching enzyme